MGGTQETPCGCGGGSSGGCGCQTPKKIKVYTPGKPIQITWSEYSKEWDGLCDGALAVGVPYCVVDGPCPGWYIPTDASQGKAGDRIVKMSNIGVGLKADGCQIVVDPDYIQELIGDFFDSACYMLPALPATATNFKKVAFAADNGCGKLYTYEDGALVLGRVYSIPLHGDNHDLLMPANPSVAGRETEYYSWSGFSAAAAAGGLDPEISSKTRMIDDSVIVPSADTYRLRLTGSVEFDPSQNDGNGAASRVVLRINDSFSFSPSGLVTAFTPFTNYELGISRELTAPLLAGANRLEAWVVSVGTGIQEAAQLRVRSVLISPGVYSTSMNISVERL